MRYLVVIPTFNEVESAPHLIRRIMALVSDIDVLVVDDGSTDGTSSAVHDLSKEFPSNRISILQRDQKLGLGSAYCDGFKWGFSKGYLFLIEMDADGSHRAEDLVQLLKRLEENIGCDLLVGSRWINGGAVQDWSKYREYLSRLANTYARLLLKSHVRDMTSGFRIYKASTLKKIDFRDVQSQGYCFQIEMTRKIQNLGGTILEFPITFIERKYGSSKMNWKIVLEAIVRVTFWGLARK